MLAEADLVDDGEVAIVQRGDGGLGERTAIGVVQKGDRGGERARLLGELGDRVGLQRITRGGAEEEPRRRELVEGERRGRW